MGSISSSCVENEPFKAGAFTPMGSEMTLTAGDNSNTTTADDTSLSSTGWKRSFKHFLHSMSTNWLSKDRSLQSSCHGIRRAPDNQTQNARTGIIPKGTVLLMGCNTIEEHFDAIGKALDRAMGLDSDRGLRAMGFEYRLLPCDEHKDLNHHLLAQSANESLSRSEEKEFFMISSTSVRLIALKEKSDQLQAFRDSDVQSLDGSLSETSSSHRRSLKDLESFNQSDSNNNGPKAVCNLCCHRLFHRDSCRIVDIHNRQEMIADGQMYERICELTQESAQSMMIREGDLEWVEIDNAEHKPLRVLVSKNRGDNETQSPVFVVCTGRGKVGAGIFSRYHLLCSGLELATAVPLVREAIKRGFRIVIVDPNVHGEAQGFNTFCKTMHFVTKKCFGEGNPKLVYLCHSASGGHMARYLLQTPEERILDIQAVAFTDSTHSVQWAKTNKVLMDLLQSQKCIYFRSSREQDGVGENKWYLHAAGEPVQTDSFWVHRFGNIRTLWAGTNEHSLTNWYAHAKIWEHYDSMDLKIE